MKRQIVYIILICLGLYLSTGIVMAQSGSEIKFNFLNIPLNNDTNSVTVSAAVNARQSILGDGIHVSAAVNAKQSVSYDGIHFSLIVKNNITKAIAIKNIADQLIISLYDTSGLNVAIPNMSVLAEMKRYDLNWEFRSGSVIPDKIYINGKEENNDPKKQEYIKIPGGGNCNINLIIKNVKQVETSKNVDDKILKPRVNLAEGKYKLKLSFLNITNDGSVAIFHTQMIDIDYSN